MCVCVREKERENKLKFSDLKKTDQHINIGGNVVWKNVAFEVDKHRHKKNQTHTKMTNFLFVQRSQRELNFG